MGKPLSRKECIEQDATTCKFVVLPNAKAEGKEPIYELASFSEVNRHSALIDRVAKDAAVDARLIRAIMYMETTHGYYDAPLALFGANKSILPMNVNVDYWGNAFGNREALSKPYENIKAGATILKRIMNNLPTQASVKEIATLYNNINARSVNDYGARVEKIYNSQPWTKGSDAK
jgi:hypothetical protein